MKIIIIGAGLGGLTCAIACRRENLDVVVLERSPQLLPAGAGIQIPPNGARVLQELNLVHQVLEKGTVVESMDLRRYKDGSVITSMECGETVAREYGSPWIIIHRADYQQILFDRATSMGVEIRFGANLQRIDFEATAAILEGGKTVAGDVIIGADGLWSTVREEMSTRSFPPIETGDMAYRAVFPRSQLEALGDPEVTRLCNKVAVTAWLGPDKHAVFYPVRGGEEFNLVLLQPDKMPAGVRTDEGDLEEVQSGFRDWDTTLQRLITCISSVVRWKLCHLPELETWTKGRVTLLGDACHPTLPYQAQGAAMAVQDGAVLGMLLGHVAKRLADQGDLEIEQRKITICDAFGIYEDLRKARTTASVKGALRNREVFHMQDGILQWLRDLVLGYSGMTQETDWIGLMSKRQAQSLASDALAECKRRLDEA
ncbi:putative salicylate hydroxylase [Aspergillus alliaceus]|uniref:putative salicylate hydroxylase n=1 Tax=Petromyces alliaceus TaxID=209559 RepID=UPI0012A45CDA|nr:uncharacterized protein BDW43DRAFT_123226 [Aspergillus alliaceus]KAB8238715.1 hypothetical protein BDW43DRAFT_123226 [Aspergillus alliaceus]